MNNQKIRTLLLTMMIVVMAGLTNLAFSQQEEPQATQQAEQDYSKQEIKNFIDANEEATKVQQEAEQKMMSAIEEVGLDVNTFNQILSSQQQGAQDPQASEEDMEKFNKAAEKVMEIQQETNVDIEAAIEESGIEVEKFKEMMIAYQQNPDLQQKVNQMLEEENK